MPQNHIFGSQFSYIEPRHTGDRCFHCNKDEYWWGVQIQSTKPEGIVNICLCPECVLLDAETLLKPLLKRG